MAYANPHPYVQHPGTMAGHPEELHINDQLPLHPPAHQHFQSATPRSVDYTQQSYAHVQHQQYGLVQIAHEEYNRLLNIANQYANLCQSLMLGGVDYATIQVLSNSNAQRQGGHDSSAEPQPASDAFDPAQNSNSTAPHQRSRPTRGRQRSLSGECEDRSTLEDQSTLATSSSSSDTASLSDDAPPRPYSNATTSGGEFGVHYPLHHAQRDAMRSLTLAKLPDGATHADIAATVRGGQVLDIYVRRRDRAATVSFVHGSDAEAFLDHASKFGIHVKNVQVGVEWADRQYVLAPHLGHRIAGGASRNLIIRGCKSDINEHNVRDDLEHIHNLFVLDVSFDGGDCLISTNSVRMANFARTCMMSQLRYRHFRIDYDFDECSEHLEANVNTTSRTAPPTTAVKGRHSAANRFELLRLQDE